MIMRFKLGQHFHNVGKVVPCLAVLACLLATNAAAMAQSKVSEKEWAAAINLSGRQRMLTQKMTKEFLLVTLKVDEEANKKHFKESVGLFNDTLNRLASGDKELSIPAPPSKEIQEQLNQVRTLWKQFKATTEKGIQGGTIPPETIAEVAELNIPLLQEMSKAVGLYERESQRAGVKGLGTVVNVAGRQRMLTQKLCKELLLIALGVEPEANRQALQQTKELFQKSLVGLVQGSAELGVPPTKSPSVLTQMGKVEALWKELARLVELGCASPQISPEVIKKVAELNPRLLREMNRAVTMYEAEAKP